MENGLSKLLNGELVRATLEFKKENSASEEKYLEKIHQKVKSLGYEVVGVLQDMENKSIYHVSIAKEDIF